MPRKKSDPPGMPHREHAAVVKGTPEWKAWIEKAAVRERTNVSTLVDQALTWYVKAYGFDKPPPVR